MILHSYDIIWYYITFIRTCPDRLIDVRGYSLNCRTDSCAISRERVYRCVCVGTAGAPRKDFPKFTCRKCKFDKKTMSHLDGDFSVQLTVISRYRYHHGRRGWPNVTKTLEYQLWQQLSCRSHRTHRRVYQWSVFRGRTNEYYLCRRYFLFWLLYISAVHNDYVLSTFNHIFTRIKSIVADFEKSKLWFEFVIRVV